LEHCHPEVRAPGKLAALIRPNDTIGNPELCHEGPEDGQGGLLGFGKERPNPSQLTVNNEEVGAKPIVRTNDPVEGLIGAFVVFCGRPKKTKIHEEFGATTGDALSSFLG
jgi:hypothetical protein